MYSPCLLFVSSPARPKQKNAVSVSFPPNHFFPFTSILVFFLVSQCRQRLVIKKYSLFIFTPKHYLHCSKDHCTKISIFSTEQQDTHFQIVSYYKSLKNYPLVISSFYQFNRYLPSLSGQQRSKHDPGCSPHPFLGRERGGGL